MPTGWTGGCHEENNTRRWLDCLVILGGNGTHKTANLLFREGRGCSSSPLPKTIDLTILGHRHDPSASRAPVDIATAAIDCIHTTAASHGRVFIVEVMGHKVGWLTLHAGIAGGADIILPARNSIRCGQGHRGHRQAGQGGQRFTILAVAEGAISK